MQAVCALTCPSRDPRTPWPHLLPSPRSYDLPRTLLAYIRLLSASPSCPNNHSNSNNAPDDFHSDSFCWILLYKIRQGKPSERKSACDERDSCSNRQHPGSCRTIPASPQRRTPVTRHQRCVACRSAQPTRKPTHLAKVPARAGARGPFKGNGSLRRLPHECILRLLDDLANATRAVLHDLGQSLLRHRPEVEPRVGA